MLTVEECLILKSDRALSAAASFGPNRPALRHAALASLNEARRELLDRKIAADFGITVEELRRRKWAPVC